MNKDHAKKVLKMLDRLNQEIDLLGNIILKNKMKPIPVRIKIKDGFRTR